MMATLIPRRRWKASYGSPLRRLRPSATLFTMLILFPALALAQSPFDTGFTAMQTLFTGTVAKVASLIAIVVGGYQFAHGEPGAKKTLAGVAAGTYVITIRDRSAIHNFHLTGPGVDKRTSLGKVYTTTWRVTLKKGTYTFVCDPHAAIMKGTLKVK